MIVETKVSSREWRHSPYTGMLTQEYWHECNLTGRWKIEVYNGTPTLYLEVEYEEELEHTYRTSEETEKKCRFLFWRWIEPITKYTSHTDKFKLKRIKWKGEYDINVTTKIEYDIQECVSNASD